MYRDDDRARAERAHQLIDEIAGLEREKVAQARTDHRLEQARRELSELQAAAPAGDRRGPGVAAHLLVFAGTAAAAFVGYTLLF